MMQQGKKKLQDTSNSLHLRFVLSSSSFIASICSFISSIDDTAFTACDLQQPPELSPPGIIAPAVGDHGRDKASSVAAVNADMMDRHCSSTASTESTPNAALLGDIEAEKICGFGRRRGGLVEFRSRTGESSAWDGVGDANLGAGGLKTAGPAGKHAFSSASIVASISSMHLDRFISYRRWRLSPAIASSSADLAPGTGARSGTFPASHKHRLFLAPSCLLPGLAINTSPATQLSQLTGKYGCERPVHIDAGRCLGQQTDQRARRGRALSSCKKI
eukprot:685666-Rhodomonas_salina.2